MRTSAVGRGCLFLKKIYEELILADEVHASQPIETERNEEILRDENRAIPYEKYVYSARRKEALVKRVIEKLES